MKFRIVASVLVVACLAALVAATSEPQNTRPAATSPSADDAALKSLRIE